MPRNSDLGFIVLAAVSVNSKRKHLPGVRYKLSAQKEVSMLVIR